VKGIGPKTGLNLIKKHGKIENLPNELKETLEAQNYQEVRRFFLEPKVTNNYVLRYGELQEDELYSFLCDQRDFSHERVETVIQRMKKFYASRKQTELKKWFYTN